MISSCATRKLCTVYCTCSRPVYPIMPMVLHIPGDACSSYTNSSKGKHKYIGKSIWNILGLPDLQSLPTMQTPSTKYLPSIIFFWSFHTSTNGSLVNFWVGGLDSWDCSYERDSYLGGSPRIPSHPKHPKPPNKTIKVEYWHLCNRLWKCWQVLLQMKVSQWRCIAHQCCLPITCGSTGAPENY